MIQLLCCLPQQQIQVMNRVSSPVKDCLCRVVLLGDQRVGKSSYVNRLFKEEFDETYHSTIGVDYRAKLFPFGTRTSRVHIFDSSGHPDLKNVSKSLYEYAQGFIFMYSVQERCSFGSIKEWVQIVNSERKSQSSAILLANKQDSSTRQVSSQEGRLFAESQNMHFCQVSTKEDHMVMQSLNILVEDIYRLQKKIVVPEVQKQRQQISFAPLLFFLLLITLSLSI